MEFPKKNLSQIQGKIEKNSYRDFKKRLLEARVSQNTGQKRSIQMIELDQIKFNPFQPRKVFQQKALEDLASSIQEHGIIQPVICTKDDDESYRLVVGERRCRASRLAGLTHVPVIIEEMTESRLLQVALIENIQREDLDPIETALAYSHLLREHSLTQEELAQKVGKSRPAITNSLRLLALPSPIRRSVQEGEISAGHARAILSLDKERDQFEVWNRVKRDDLSVRQTETLVRNAREGVKKQKTDRPELSPDWMEIQDHLTRQWGVTVNIRQNKKQKGKIELQYDDGVQLERIVERLIYLGERMDRKSNSQIL
jgi:ParB family transcriptional regulator, chromosome partitioning protein